MADYDLSSLEAAAARAGLSGLTARVVPPDPRRGDWFRWTGSELLVNERVLERLGPEEAAALLVHAVQERRRLDESGRRGATWLVAALFLAVAGFTQTTWTAAAGVVVVVATVLLVVADRGRARQQADDDAVELLGDAERLVRALNAIHQDELHVAGRKLNARPDIHARAERLVTMHQLRLAPEHRSCAGPGAAEGASEAACAVDEPTAATSADDDPGGTTPDRGA